MASAGDTAGSRSKLGRALRTLRQNAGLRQVDAADAIGITQASLSRAEQGQALPSPEVVRRLAELYRAGARPVAELVQLAGELRAGYVDARVVLQSGQTANLQRRFAALEENAAHVRSYQPVMVIGALQTPAYAAVVFGVDESDPLVAQRQARQHRLLAEPDRRWTFLQTEGSLRWQARSAAVMAEQLARLAELSRAPNVRLGVIDWRTPVEIFPNTAFHVYDSAAVVVGTRDGTAIMDDPARVADYRDLFDRLVALARFGDEARPVLRRIAGDYRRLTRENPARRQLLSP